MPMTVKGSRGKPGLTLIELLFAIAIMSFALLGVASMFLAAFRSVAAGGHETKATALARAMSDMIQSAPFDILSKSFSSPDWGYNGFDTRNPLPGLTCPPNSNDPNADYRKQYNQRKWKCDIEGGGVQDSGWGLPGGYGSVAVECVNTNGDIITTVPCPTDLRRVTLTVTWERQGPRSANVVTYVSRN